MPKNKTDREPYFYPDYIAEALRRLGQASSSEVYPLLNKRIDIIHVLFNQFNNYTITEQVYDYVWWLLNEMTSKGHEVWIKEYWSYACQFYILTKEYSKDNSEEQKKRFQEFHLMFGVLLVYLKRYDLLRHLCYFSSSLPAKYPLVPSTFINIYGWYKSLSRKNNQTMYLLKYHMKGMNEGATEERKIESLLLDYLSILLIRLNTVNDYNITNSNPLELPLTGGTKEETERNISIAEVLKNRIEKWERDSVTLKEIGLDSNDVAQAKTIIEEYQELCKQSQKQIQNKAEISEIKRNELKKNMLDALGNDGVKFPIYSGNIDSRFKKIVSEAEQSVELDDRLILAGRDSISSNLGEALVNALFTEMRINYCYQFLIYSTAASFAIPYRDITKALDKLDLNNDFTILAMGVSPNFYEEMGGFSRNGSKLSYKGINVIEIPSNENSFIVMRSNDIPKISLRDLSQNEIEYNMQEIDTNYHLYSNIDNINTNDIILKAKMGYLLHVVIPMKYVRLRIAYQLDSDSIVLNRVLPIKNYIV